MSTTLNLVDRLLARGQYFQQLGRDHDALAILGRLSDFRELPAEVAEETQIRLAELCLRRKRPRKARRHLTAALRHQPDHARYHYLMACAVQADRHAEPERALEHYERSIQLDGDQPDCLSAAGLLAIRQGQSERGLTWLRRAAELAPDDPEILQRLTRGLCLLCRQEEARKVLLAALFRHARDARFRKLWNDFQFDQLRQEQEAERLADRGGEAAESGPTLLPFLRPVSDKAPVRGTPAILRCDGPSATPPPHLPRPARLPRRRHAQ
jgi:Tfp pilus assembly protein PilF